MRLLPLALWRPLLWLPLSLLALAGPAAAQPTTIEIFGHPITGDAFYFFFDRSTSMATNHSLEPVKEELIAVIEQLPAHTPFGFVRFSSSPIKLWNQPMLPTPTAKQLAAQFVSVTTASGASCIGSAGVAILEIANQGNSASPRVIYIGDGGANCPGAATEIPQIANANWMALPIDAFHVGPPSVGVQAPQDLANANQGALYVIGPFQQNFVRGDVNDDAAINASDVVQLLDYLFVGGSLSCDAAADVDGDLHTDVVDAVVLLHYLFVVGPPPPPPFPACGAPTPLESCLESLSCP